MVALTEGRKYRESVSGNLCQDSLWILKQD